MQDSRITKLESSLSMSDYSYERALWMGLLGEPENIDKEEFRREVQRQLGLAPGQDCDTICGAMERDLKPVAVLGGSFFEERMSSIAFWYYGRILFSFVERKYRRSLWL